MTSFLYARERRTLLLILLILISVTAIGIGFIYVTERNKLVDLTTQHAEREIVLIGKLINEALTKGDYITVEQFIVQWVEERANLLEVKLTSHNDFILASYHRDLPTRDRMHSQQMITYGDDSSVRLDVTWDLQPVLQNLNQLILMLALIYIYMVAAVIIFLWWILRRSLLNPLHDELEDSARYNRMLFEQSPVGLALCRTNGELIDINPAYAGILGRTIDETKSLSYWDITPEKYSADEKIQLQHLENDGEYGPYEKEYIHKDGHLIPVRLKGTLLTQGEEIYIWSSVEDITEYKQAEAQLVTLNETLEARVEERTRELQRAKDQADAANQAKSEFLSNMSHEIRSPLGAIIGFSEALITDDYNEQDRKNITSIIVRNSKHLRNIINDILDLSKIESQQLEVERIETSIFSLLQEIESSLAINASDKGLDFNINYHYPLPDRVITDPTCLQQILVNLCSNAIKFTDSGRIDVDVSADNNFKEIKFVVADTGIGITDKELTRIFDVFTQADTSTTRKYGGTGLGLSISKKLAHLLNGNLTCESTRGVGSRFTLTITNMASNKATAINSLTEVSAYNINLSEAIKIKPLSGSVLLVEDIPDNQQLISMYIHKTGADLTIVDNGEKAIDIAQAQTFDLILMDMQMPVMDGLEAIKRLRDGGYNKPIVSLTANALLSDREMCIAAGADDYLVKPIELYNFYQVLNKYVPEDKDKSTINNKLQKTLHDSPQYKAIVEKFITNLPQLIEEIDSALSSKNWDVLQKKSHDLKGMGGAMGYPQITEQAALLNNLVKQANYDQLATANTELKKLCNNILDQYKSTQ